MEEKSINRKCRECREIKILNTDNFVRRTDNTNSWRGRCRVCYNKHARVRQEMSKNERAVSKKYRDKYSATKPLEMLLRHTKNNSRKYYRECLITIEYLHYLWNQQDGICYYTNKPMIYGLGFRDSVSIDRIDSSKGYIEGNIALCRKQINVMKNDATIKELLDFCEDIVTQKEKLLKLL